MSRKLLAFLLSELTVVRIQCKSCNKIIELKPEELAQQFSSGYCPLCEKPMTVERLDKNPFCQLANAVESFKRHAKFVDVEFVLEDKESV
jgi:hypothetical protein